MSLIKKILNTYVSKLIIVSFVPVVISTLAVFLNDTSDIMWLRMVWNYFLAVIPVYMALFAQHFSFEGKRIFEFIFMLLWLLFFPNSIYMLTDFKYLSRFDFQLWGIYDGVGQNLSPWLLLANLVISVGLGVLMGLISLGIIHNLLKNKFSKKACVWIVAGISLLSSFGVYIGRYARLNSWDIINPIKIVISTFDVMTPFAPVYIFIFTVLTLFLYVCYRLLLILPQILANKNSQTR